MLRRLNLVDDAQRADYLVLNSQALWQGFHLLAFVLQIEVGSRIDRYASLGSGFYGIVMKRL